MARLDMIENDVGILQRGDTYFIDVKFRDGKTSTDVTSASAEITYPCSSGSTNASLATTATTGNYQGNWAVPSSATYGEYRVKVTAVYNTITYIFETQFYILPWNITQHVRGMTGIKQNNDISDLDIAMIAWNAYLEVKDVAFNDVVNEPVHIDNNHCINGSNKAFYQQRNMVSDHLSCEEVAIEGYYVNQNYERNDLTVSITDADQGKISVADESGNALDTATYCCGYVSYRIKKQSFTEGLFKKAVSYLTAHEIILRFNELDKATLADLKSNSPVVLANPDRMYKKYKKILKRIRLIKVGGI